MQVQRITYQCDTCRQLSSAAGFDGPVEAWAHAKRAGWVRVEVIADHTGHIGAVHYCRADAVKAGVATLARTGR